MTFRLSREAHVGFALARSHAVMNEAGARDNGLLTLAESGLTPLEAHAKLAYWLGQVLTGDPVEALGVLSYQAAALAGGLMVAEEGRVETGDEIGRAA